MSDVESTGVSDVMVTVDLAEEPTPSQFHTTVVVHSSSEPSPVLTFDEAVDVITTSTAQLSVSEEPAAAAAMQEPASTVPEHEQDAITSTPVVTSSTVLPSTVSEAVGGAEAAATLPSPRPRAPFGRARASSRSQAAAQDTAASSTPFGGGHHSSGTRSNNELSHSTVMDTLFRRHSKAESSAPAARRQQQDTSTRTTSSSNQTSSSSMSVSVPNLTSTMEQTVSLLETFAMVARRNLGNNSGSVMSAVTGSNNNPCSSLVRLALSSNSPGTSSAYYNCLCQCML